MFTFTHRAGQKIDLGQSKACAGSDAQLHTDLWTVIFGIPLRVIDYIDL